MDKKKGKPKSEETKRKMSEAKRGDKCYKWRHDVDVEEVMRLRSLGATYQQIGLELGVSANLVRRRVLSQGGY